MSETVDRASGPLSLLCVGTGRDGTLSVTQMIEGLFEYEGRERRVAHEYWGREFYHNFSLYEETRGEQYLKEIRGAIDECPYHAIVGNGYAPILQLFAERYGGKLRLLHLRRRDRAACVTSLKKNCELFPTAWGNYSLSPAATTKRMAAFHFGEMTQREWEELSLTDKIGWYYDKTHALIESCKHCFKQYIDIATEDLNTESTRRLIASLLLEDNAVLPRPVKVNAYKLDWIADLPADRHDKMQWLLGRLDLQQLAYDDAFAVKYFLNKFVAWTGYQIRGTVHEISPADTKNIQDMAITLETVERVLREGIRDVEALRAMLASNGLAPNNCPAS